MIKGIRRILGLCDHKWDIIEKGHLTNGPAVVVVGRWYILQCTHCGNVKKKGLRP